MFHLVDLLVDPSDSVLVFGHLLRMAASWWIVAGPTRQTSSSFGSNEWHP